MHTHACTLSHTHARTHTHTRTFARTFARTLTSTLTRTLTHTLTRTLACTHAHTHALTYTHARSHIHMHTHTQYSRAEAQTGGYCNSSTSLRDHLFCKTSFAGHECSTLHTNIPPLSETTFHRFLREVS